MSTHWTINLAKPERPVADGVARADYLRRARNQRRTKGASDWTDIKVKSRFRQAKPVSTGSAIQRLSQEALDWLLRPRAGHLTVRPNGRPETAETHLNLMTPAVRIERTYRRQKSGQRLLSLEGKVVRTFESRDMHAHRWDPVQARFIGGLRAPPAPTRAPLTPDEQRARFDTIVPDITPGKESES